MLRTDSARLIVRPSGTEPKLKCYLEIIRIVDESVDGALAVAKADAAERIDRLAAAVTELVGLGP
ncbi:MAG: hypothetical protein WKF43_05005 [Acidimicrobiales bacterium]